MPLHTSIPHEDACSLSAMHGVVLLQAAVWGRDAGWQLCKAAAVTNGTCHINAQADTAPLPIIQASTGPQQPKFRCVRA